MNVSLISWLLNLVDVNAVVNVEDDDDDDVETELLSNSDDNLLLTFFSSPPHWSNEIECWGGWNWWWYWWLWCKWTNGDEVIVFKQTNKYIIIYGYILFLFLF